MKRSMSDTALRFADDDDMLSFESRLDLGNGNGIWPRSDKTGKPIRSWDRYHQKAMNELARRLRASKDTAEPFELGRLDQRSVGRMREPAACLALHFLFVDAQQTEDNYLGAKADYYWRLSGSMFEAESALLDYDTDGNGIVDEIEKNQSFPARVIRG